MENITMKLHIKNMVSIRCQIVVKQEMKKLGLQHLVVDLGLVEVSGTITDQQYQNLKFNLHALGLELLDDKRKILIERVVNAVTEMINDNDLLQVNYSDAISQKLDYDYTYLSKIFSQEKGITLQQFIINRKVEKVKELLLYQELNLTEISRKLHYSSVGHLSNQFKKVTGFSPTVYEQLHLKRNVNLENTGHV